MSKIIMRVYGIDFTSVPCTRKPITCIKCKFGDGVLTISDFMPFESWGKFENFLIHEGPWIVGIDFPFGQPRKLINNLRWPENWENYVKHVSLMSQSNFEKLLTNYKIPRPEGDKEHLRATDKKAGSKSPMKLYGVPVAKMFFQGAPRLLKSKANILPCYKNKTNKTIIEAYPAIVARNLIGRTPYKGEQGDQQAKYEARRNIIKELDKGKFISSYGFRVLISHPENDRLTNDRSGDWLDSLLCAVQAAWSYSQETINYGIPLNCDISEGWIIDPSMLYK